LAVKTEHPRYIIVGLKKTISIFIKI